MDTTLKSSPTLQDKLAELKETQEREKIELTPEVEQYYQEHVEAVQEKLAQGEAILESDMEFVDAVKLWMGAQENVRKKIPSIEEMLKEKKEAEERNITLAQWLGLLHIVYATEKEKEWIDEQFNFENNKIMAEILDLSGSDKLISLPEGLEILDDLRLERCTQFISLPQNLKIGRNLVLDDCTKLTSLPKDLIIGQNLSLQDCINFTSLPEKLKLRYSLHLEGCISLTFLPEGLDIGESLYLDGCVNLTALPESLAVRDALYIGGCSKLKSLPHGLDLYYLFLSKNCNKQLKKDAKKLKIAGKIKEKIIYR